MYFKKTDSRLFPLYNKNISIYAKYKKKKKTGIKKRTL